MTLLLRNSTPAERQRGLIFVETFRSVDDVFKNGATIGGGTPTFTPGAVTFDGASYLNYPAGNTKIRTATAFTFDLECTPVSTTGTPVMLYVGVAGGGADTGLGIGITGGNWGLYRAGVGWFDIGLAAVVGRKDHIAVTCPSGPNVNAPTYVNGVAGNVLAAYTHVLTSADLYIGARKVTDYSTSLIHSVRVFDQQLSPEEVLQYAQGTVLNHRSRVSVCYPMTNACHQATQTLDVSGNGRHGVFSASVPTKLVGRMGYNFGGVNQYTESTLNGAFDTPEWSVAIEYETGVAFAGKDMTLMDTTGALTRFRIYKSGVPDLAIWVAGKTLPVIASATASPYWWVGPRNTIVVSAKTGKNNVWMNGVRVLADDGTLWSAVTTSKLYLAVDNGLATAFDGRILRVSSWPQALTSLQVYDHLSRWQRTESDV